MSGTIRPTAPSRCSSGWVTEMVVALVISLCGPSSCDLYEVGSWSGPHAAQTCEVVLDQLRDDRERFCEHVPTHE